MRAALIAAIVALAAPSGANPNGNVVRVEHRDPTTVPTRGPTTALVTIELFIDPMTNMLARRPIYRALERLQQNHPARIRLIYRIKKGGAQQQIAIAALEAHAQGKFDEFMEELHRDKTTTMVTRDQLFELARRADVDTARLATAISEGRYADVFELTDSRLDRLAHTATVPNALFNAKVPRASMGAPSDSDLEREYQTAYTRAQELVDRGVPVHHLLHAFEQQALRSTQPFVVSNSGDDDFESTDSDHKLAKPPLDLRGLPSYGKPDGSPIPVVVICRPNDSDCHNKIRLFQKLQKTYANGIKIVWAPWFDVANNESASELARLGDAMLCAEQVGSSPDEPAASPGWRWVSKQLEMVNRTHGRRGDIEKLVDEVTSELEIDSQRLSACRARIAGATLDFVDKARKSGVSKAPALVIGGRIYEGLNDQNLIQQLIEAELAPGVLARCATIGCTYE